ncbi:MAG: pyruvate ferredoxin oxidoreductase, partial [Crenarchaeota archaeon]|nr:pyruvate ferredoxin oxidoreductase [Thermoproteota archaeon]
AKSISYSRLAVESCIFPIYEVINGKYQLSTPSKVIQINPVKKKPVEEYLQGQGRFKHLFKPNNNNIIEQIQRATDENWEKLLKKSQCATIQTDQ